MLYIATQPGRVFVLVEFEATADGRLANGDSERTLLTIPEPQGNHNAGDLRFGPEGYLYVAVGDGGGGGDRDTGYVEDWYRAVSGGNGQDVAGNRLGGILRIDVNGREDGQPYAVPDDNPIVGRAGFDGYYAWGLHNPWRTSFDGSDYYGADVGESRYEEVNPHSGASVSGISVIGGDVYRGSAVPDLGGRYVFGDLRAKGRLFVASRPDDGGLWPTRTLGVADADPGGGRRGPWAWPTRTLGVADADPGRGRRGPWGWPTAKPNSSGSSRSGASQTASYTCRVGVPPAGDATELRLPRDSGGQAGDRSGSK